MTNISNQALAILIIIALAIAVGSCITVIFYYQRMQETQEKIYEIQLEVREKMLIDSVLSVYESRHRSRLDSISKGYSYRIDSLSVRIDQLKEQTHVIQTNLVPADSLLPVY